MAMYLWQESPPKIGLFFCKEPINSGGLHMVLTPYGVDSIRGPRIDRVLFGKRVYFFGGVTRKEKLMILD